MAASFNSVTPALLDELRRVLGDKFVKTDDDYLERYQTDEEGNSHYFHKPEVVVFPGSTEEVAEVVKLANKYLVPITPRSAGSGVACGAIPVYHGIVVELERMNQILTFDADNMYAVCQTGVITGARLKKCSTGLCLEQLFAGSEGVLGIITEVTVKLRPMPPYTFNMVCVFKTDEEAFALPNKILKAGIDPTSIEFMDNEALRMTCKFLDMKMPHVDEGCDYVIVTVESFSEDDSDRKMEQLCDLAEENGSIDEFEADKRIWKLRKQFAEAARDVDKMFQTEDFVVPLDKIPDITKQIPELREKYDLYCVTVAHIGDGNIHVLPLNAKGLSPEEWFEKIKAFHRDLFPRVYALGGKMSGEHGVGFKKLEEFALCTPEAELNVIKAIKKALDPNNVMNPGKLVQIC